MSTRTRRQRTTKRYGGDGAAGAGAAIAIAQTGCGLFDSSDLALLPPSHCHHNRLIEVVGGPVPVPTRSGPVAMWLVEDDWHEPHSHAPRCRRGVDRLLLLRPKNAGVPKTQPRRRRYDRRTSHSNPTILVPGERLDRSRRRMVPPDGPTRDSMAVVAEEAEEDYYFERAEASPSAGAGYVGAGAGSVGVARRQPIS